MAQLGQEFNAEEVEPSVAFDPLPNGKYVAAIVDSEWQKTKAGTGHMLKLTLEVLEGDHKGRKVWDQLNLDNPNHQAVEIAKRTLSAICHACGVLRVQDSSELHNIPMLVKLRVTHDEGHESRNEVRGYAAVAGATITTPAVTKPAAKPTGRPAAAPWAKAKSGEAA